MGKDEEEESASEEVPKEKEPLLEVAEEEQEPLQEHAQEKKTSEVDEEPKQIPSKEVDEENGPSKVAEEQETAEAQESNVVLPQPIQKATCQERTQDRGSTREHNVAVHHEVTDPFTGHELGFIEDACRVKKDSQLGDQAFDALFKMNQRLPPNVLAHVPSDDVVFLHENVGDQRYSGTMEGMKAFTEDASRFKSLMDQLDAVLLYIFFR